MSMDAGNRTPYTGMDMGAAREAADAKKVQKTQNFTTNDPAVADKVAKDFEAMFLQQMLQPMFAGLKGSAGPFGGGHGEDAFSSMMVDEYGKIIANRGGIGVAEMVRREILKTQEQSAAGAPAAPTVAAKDAYKPS